MTTNTIHILHIDDEPDFSDVVATFLEREDDRIEVQTATNPDGGLEILTDHDVDCIVSDYDMPRQNGGVQIRMKSEAVRFLSDSCPKTTASTAV